MSAVTSSDCMYRWIRGLIHVTATYGNHSVSTPHKYTSGVHIDMMIVLPQHEGPLRAVWSLCGLFVTRVSSLHFSLHDLRRYLSHICAGHIAWISSLISKALAAAPSSLSVEISIFITGRRNPVQLPAVVYRETTSLTVPSINGQSSSDQLDGKAGLPVYDALKVVYGRPDIEKILGEEVGSATGPVSVDGKSLEQISPSTKRLIQNYITLQSLVLLLWLKPCGVR